MRVRERETGREMEKVRLRGRGKDREREKKRERKRERDAPEHIFQMDWKRVCYLHIINFSVSNILVTDSTLLER